MSRLSHVIGGRVLCGLSCLTLSLLAPAAHAGGPWSNLWSQWSSPQSHLCVPKNWWGGCNKRRPSRPTRGTFACRHDAQCADHNPGTIDWCHEGTCRHSARQQPKCSDPAAAWCYRDWHCSDWDPSTLDWCSNLRCHHAPRDSHGRCDALDDPTDNDNACELDRDCHDGARHTLDWCHEGQCVHTDRKQASCREGDPTRCCKDWQCNDQDSDTIDWCDASQCHHAPRNTGVCEPDADNPPKQCDPADCPSDGNECTYPLCRDNACVQLNRPKNFRCTGGVCVDGECQARPANESYLVTSIDRPF